VEAINAGTDVQSAGWKRNQPWATGGAYIDDIPTAVRTGRLNESAVNEARTLPSHHCPPPPLSNHRFHRRATWYASVY
jgi:hypothetical protein